MDTITKDYIGLAREIKTNIKIRHCEGVFSAVWDTGSTSTAISVALAKKLGIKRIAECIQHTVNRSRTAGIYMCDIILGKGLVFNDIEIVDGNFHTDDFLIGMDIIAQGKFVIENIDGSTTMSFSR